MRRVLVTFRHEGRDMPSLTTFCGSPHVGAAACVYIQNPKSPQQRICIHCGETHNYAYPSEADAIDELTGIWNEEPEDDYSYIDPSDGTNAEGLEVTMQEHQRHDLSNPVQHFSDLMVKFPDGTSRLDVSSTTEYNPPTRASTWLSRSAPKGKKHWMDEEFAGEY